MDNYFNVMLLMTNVLLFYHDNIIHELSYDIFSLSTVRLLFFVIATCTHVLVSSTNILSYGSDGITRVQKAGSCEKTNV